MILRLEHRDDFDGYFSRLNHGIFSSYNTIFFFFLSVYVCVLGRGRGDLSPT